MSSRYFHNRRLAARVTRRTLIGGTAGSMGITAAVLAACGGSSKQESDSAATTPGTGTAAATAPRTGGTLIVAHATEEPPNLDVIAGTSTTFHQILAMFYNGLLRFKPDVADASEIEGDLAQSYEVVSPTQFAFKLPDGVTWHDGQPFTAEDVRFTFDVYAKSEGHKAEALAGVDKIEVPDPQTVTITTSRPRASMLPWLSINSMDIGPAHLLKENIKSLEKRVMGTGAYRFERYEPGVAISGTRNQKYFKQGLPYLDGLECLLIPDENARLGALRSGRLQMLTRLRQPQAEAAESKDIQVQTAAAMSNGVVGGNLRREPFNDQRVRTAISLAFDRQAALTAILGGDGVIGSPIFAPKLARTQEELLTLPGYDNTKKDEDIARAKQLLAAAGYGDGFETTITTRAGHPQYEAVSVFAVDQLKKIGITVTIKSIDNATLTKVRNDGDFDMIGVAGTSYIPDPTGTTNYWGPESRDFPVTDARIIDLLAQVESVLDHEQRSKVTKDLELALVEYAPYVQTFWSNEHDAMSTKLNGYTKMIGLYGNMRFEGTWLAG